MLKSHIEEIRTAIRAGQFLNEAAVSQGVVLRILSALGWPTYDTQVVIPEYSLEGRRVDFALCHPAGKPLVFIEVKQVGQSDGAERQLFEYAFHKGVPLAILSDGREWHFFLPAAPGDYNERRVYKLDIVEREIEESARRFERYLRYADVCSGAALKAAQGDYEDVTREKQTSDRLPEAWRSLAEEGYDLLIDLLADRVESLCGYRPDPDTVTRFLNQQVTLNLSPQPVQPPAPPKPPVALPITMPGLPAVGFVLEGHAKACRNARHVLVSVFEDLGDRDPSFLERFASLPKHGSKRRYLARDANDLYPGRPDLAQTHSYQLKSGWWLGFNCSNKAKERIIKMACEVAGLSYGRDLVISLGD